MRGNSDRKCLSASIIEQLAQRYRELNIHVGAFNYILKRMIWHICIYIVYRIVKALKTYKSFVFNRVRYWVQNHFSSKTCVKQPLSKRPKIGFQDQLSLNAGQKYCRMLPRGGEHSAIFSTFIKLQINNMIFVLSIFEWFYGN